MELHSGDLTAGLAPARTGSGPLLQRDYWARIHDARLRPSEVMEQVRRHFEAFAPAELAAFHASNARGLQLGDDLEIEIAGAGQCEVRVVHLDAQSLTLGTLEGHPEAGRITFGAYRDEGGALVFHIRSRARSDSLLRLLGFVLAGEAMQTNTWTQFISRVAALAGGRIDGFVEARTETLEDTDGEEDVLDEPTFLARGD